MRGFFKISSYFSYYSRVDKRPSYLHIIFLWPFFLRHPKSNIALFQRFMQANSLPNEANFRDEGPLPEISCLLVITQKDFINLSDCIEGLVMGSKNPINKFFFVTPSRYVVQCQSLVQDILPLNNFEILSDESIVSVGMMDKLKSKFGSSFGWVLQQFLTVAFIIESQENGILALDGDTILLRPQTWLSNNGMQALMVSNEYHSAYYQLLTKIDSSFKSANLTFVTHHMLFQPSKMRAILEKIGVRNIDDLVDLVLPLVDIDTKSPICIEFELYAQSMIQHFPELIRLIRFSNIPFTLPISENYGRQVLTELKRSLKYNSVSVHSWISKS